MALMNCPECGHTVSSLASSCPKCGCPVSSVALSETVNRSNEDDANNEIEYLLGKIAPSKKTIIEPRVRVCIKCGTPYQTTREIPGCSCSINGTPYPSVKVDFPLEQSGVLSSDLYIHEYCVIPRNIGDNACDAYKANVKQLYDRKARGEKYNRDVCKLSNWQISATPPEEKYIGWRQQPQAHIFPASQPTGIPTCPICKSTSLTKITTAKKAGKIALFGIFGAGDVGKTWKCNKCGSKF